MTFPDDAVNVMLPLAAMFTLLLEYEQLVPVQEITPTVPDETFVVEIVVLFISFPPV